MIGLLENLFTAKSANPAPPPQVNTDDTGATSNDSGQKDGNFISMLFQMLAVPAPQIAKSAVPEELQSNASETGTVLGAVFEGSGRLQTGPIGIFAPASMTVNAPSASESGFPEILSPQTDAVTNKNLPPALTEASVTLPAVADRETGVSGTYAVTGAGEQSNDSLVTQPLQVARESNRTVDESDSSLSAGHAGSEMISWAKEVPANGMTENKQQMSVSVKSGPELSGMPGREVAISAPLEMASNPGNDLSGRPKSVDIQRVSGKPETSADGRSTATTFVGKQLSYSDSPVRPDQLPTKAATELTREFSETDQGELIDVTVHGKQPAAETAEVPTSLDRGAAGTGPGERALFERATTSPLQSGRGSGKGSSNSENVTINASSSKSRQLNTQVEDFNKRASSSLESTDRQQSESLTASKELTPSVETQIKSSQTSKEFFGGMIPGLQMTIELQEVVNRFSVVLPKSNTLGSSETPSSGDVKAEVQLKEAGPLKVQAEPDQGAAFRSKGDIVNPRNEGGESTVKQEEWSGKYEQTVGETASTGNELQTEPQTLAVPLHEKSVIAGKQEVKENETGMAVDQAATVDAESPVVRQPGVANSESATIKMAPVSGEPARSVESRPVVKDAPANGRHEEDEARQRGAKQIVSVAPDKHVAQKDATSKTVTFEVQAQQMQKPDSAQVVPQAEKIPMLLQNIPDDFARNLVAHISDGLKAQIEGSTSELRVVMKPDTLGELSLRVAMEDGKLAATMQVSQPAVKHALEAQLPQLREALASQGIDIRRFDIVSENDKGFVQPDEGKASQQHQQRSKRQTDVDVAETYEHIRHLGYNTIEYII